MTRRAQRKPRRLPLPPEPPRPMRAEHWLTRHEREREAMDEQLRNRVECVEKEQPRKESTR
jgi:hypothetical protein